MYRIQRRGCADNSSAPLPGPSRAGASMRSYRHRSLHTSLPPSISRYCFQVSHTLLLELAHGLVAPEAALASAASLFSRFRRLRISFRARSYAFCTCEWCTGTGGESCMGGQGRNRAAIVWRRRALRWRPSQRPVQSAHGGTYLLPRCRLLLRRRGRLWLG